MLTLVALTAILALIFMSNQFVHYLNRAATGEFPAKVIFELMLIEMPNLLVLLLPLGLYMAMMLAYGRLNAESEMTILRTAGMGDGRLLAMSLRMSLGLFVFITFVVLWGSPHIARVRASILHAAGIKTFIQTIMPGRFHLLSDGVSTVYVESLNRAHTEGHNIFIARRVLKNEGNHWDIVTAKEAKIGDGNDDNQLTLSLGSRYVGNPGDTVFDVAHFESYHATLPKPRVSFKDDYRTRTTSQLFPYTHDPKRAAELNWRLSIPIMVLVLTLIAVPLSRLHPRQGKYAKLFPAILIYIIYANFMFVARDWVVSGKTPMWLGMMWLHVVFAMFGLYLLYYNRKHFS